MQGTRQKAPRWLEVPWAGGTRPPYLLIPDLRFRSRKTVAGLSVPDRYNNGYGLTSKVCVDLDAQYLHQTGFPAHRPIAGNRLSTGVVLSVCWSPLEGHGLRPRSSGDATGTLAELSFFGEAGGCLGTPKGVSLNEADTQH